MKAGYIAIVGEPNVGKSTLLNHLLQIRLSIVSSKPQTTRKRLLGILTEDEYQCYFLDTPGMIQPDYELQNCMVHQIIRALADADIILWIVDPWYKIDTAPKQLTEYFTKKPSLCAINKIDLVQKSELLPIINGLREYALKEIVPISALTGDGIDKLKKVLFALLPEGPFLYPVEDISDSPERFFAAEIIRKQIFERFRKEVPYSTAIVVDEFKERRHGKDYVKAVIYVERKTQKAIIIGKNGEALKKVGEAARREIELFLGRPVYLELWVKVKEKWRKNKKFLKELGY